ncbi:MAG: GTPase, partial [Alkalispirochaeta sp.]
MSNRPQSTPRALRPHIVLVGKCNAGKSALLNALAGDELAIVSATAGTTTDPVTRASELVPWGPVVYVDTAGSDDESALGAQRGSKAARAVAGADVVLYVYRPGTWDQRDSAELERLREMSLPVVVVATHADLATSEARAEPAAQEMIHVGSLTGQGVPQLREHLIEILRRRGETQKTLLEDLVRPYRLIMLVVPIDLEAPAGRLIMPQVQTIREALDGDAMTVVVKEREIAWALQQLSRPPDLVITDS